MIELIVMLVVLASMSAIVVPQVLGRLRTSEAATVAQTLAGARTAVIAFRRDVLQYPSNLTHLSSVPAGSSVDPCGRPYGSTARWSGPYLDRVVPAAGLKVGSTIVQNSLPRVPPDLTTGLYGTLFLNVDEVDLDVAQTVDAAMDGDGALTSGTITWAAAVGTPTRGRLSLGIPVRGC